MTTTEDVARIARAAGEAGDRGESHYTPAGYGPMNLNETGYCTRFVRQCHEAALGLPYRLWGPFPWRFAAPNAVELEKNLKAAKKRILTPPQPGDIVCINRGSGQLGHVGIVLDGGRFAENTSSVSRGPGTTISDLSAVVSRITGYYRALPVASGSAGPETDLAVVLQLEEGAPGTVIDCKPEWREDTVVGEVRAVVEALGYTVGYHAHTDGRQRVYIKPGGAT